MIIAVDFDGTIVNHCYPDLGDPVPGALQALIDFVNASDDVRLILWTMRSGKELDDAVRFLEERHIPLFGINENPYQGSWTQSPKAYANLYIDDAAFGCPLRDFPMAGSRPCVDWSIVAPKVLEMIKQRT